MLYRTEATIFLADHRGCVQEEWHRSFHTFNFGYYFSESRKSFFNLQVVNDDTLKEGGTLKLDVTDDSIILLLPLVGTLKYQNQFEQGKVEVGQCCYFFAQKGTSFEVINPYKNELINFLQIWIKTESDQNQNISGKSEFDLEFNKNQLIPLQSSTGENSSFIGKFDGRREGSLALRNPQKGAFVFIIEGAFEVQNRLLQLRDGLALWNTSEIEFEALSNEAIILIIEN